MSWLMWYTQPPISQMYNITFLGVLFVDLSFVFLFSIFLWTKIAFGIAKCLEMLCPLHWSPPHNPFILCCCLLITPVCMIHLISTCLQFFTHCLPTIISVLCEWLLCVYIIWHLCLSVMPGYFAKTSKKIWKIGNLTDKQAQHALAEKCNETKNQQVN